LLRPLNQMRSTTAGRRGRGAPLRSPRGETPRPLRGSTPAPAGAGAPKPLPGSHRAPPRGVDVKETPAERSRGARRALKTPFFSKNAQNGLFWPFSPFLAFLAKFGYFGPRTDPPARGVLHQPLAPGPCNPENRLFRGTPGVGPKTPFLGYFGGKSAFSRIQGSGPQRASEPPRPGTGPRREGLM